MNYLILKTIVDSTIQNYNHTNQMTKISENNVYIVNMHQKGIDMLIKNPHTNQEVTVHAEVNFMNGSLPANFTLAGTGITKSTNQVNDNDVTNVHQALKKTSSVSDLFGE